MTTFQTILKMNIKIRDYEIPTYKKRTIKNWYIMVFLLGIAWVAVFFFSFLFFCQNLAFNEALSFIIKSFWFCLRIQNIVSCESVNLLNKCQVKFPHNFRSAFFWFAQDERPKVRAANPNYAVGDIAKELGRRWADSQPNIKSIYEGWFSFLLFKSF